MILREFSRAYARVSAGLFAGGLWTGPARGACHHAISCTTATPGPEEPPFGNAAGGDAVVAQATTNPEPVEVQEVLRALVAAGSSGQAEVAVAALVRSGYGWRPLGGKAG